MAIAAAGLGSVTEQGEWTVGRWRAVSALLPAHEARQDMRAAHRALMPKLWQYAHQQYQAVWERWRAIADGFHQDGPSGTRSYPPGVVVSPKGLGQKLRQWFGGMVRSE